MQKPEKGNTPRAVTPTGPRGRFVGLVGVGKERYQVHLVETIGEVVVKREVLLAGRRDVVQGVEVQGESLAVALEALKNALTKRIRDTASELWTQK